MVSETPNDNVINFPEQEQDKHLLPVRYPQQDLFICDVADAVLKDIMPQLEHPFYSLSKKPETTVRRYEHNGDWIEVVPSVKGLATIYDKDILIYAISQIMAKLNRGEEVKRRVRINAHELLQFTNRGTGGKDYAAICEALDRLDGTRIRTNIRRGDEEHFNAFGLIDAAAVARKFGLDGRLLWVSITLSDWVFDAIRDRQVLSLHPDYFRLRRPLERRVYELARKHCGQQPSWKCSVDLLRKKSGSKSEMKRFRQMLKGIAENDHLPDYMLEFLGENDQLLFINRNTMPKDKPERDKDSDRILARLDPDINEKARKIAQGWDIHYVRDCFAAWWAKIGKPDTKNPDALFLKFCRTWQEKKGRP